MDARQDGDAHPQTGDLGTLHTAHSQLKIHMVSPAQLQILQAKSSSQIMVFNNLLLLASSSPAVVWFAACY